MRIDSLSLGLPKVGEWFIAPCIVRELLLVHPIPLHGRRNKAGVTRFGWASVVWPALSVNRIAGREWNGAGDNGGRGSRTTGVRRREPRKQGRWGGG